ncbi:Arb2 domain-containing protein [Sporodiniella umbellata]|nr:Arb2 domain-containing protein [Sporodiniella umbellata]
MYRRRKAKTVEKPEIPDNLDDFGYVIKENGQIRSKTQDEPYIFDYLPKDRRYNEARYKAFIELLEEELERRLVQAPFHFEKKTIPLEADPTRDPHSYIYMTPNAMTTSDKLIVFIPGSHTSIGEWSKRVLCDDNINTGSMMDATRRVQEKGYEVMILNPNANHWYNNKAWDTLEPHVIHPTLVPGSELPENHCDYVFEHFITRAKAEKIAVLASGWGGFLFAQSFDIYFDVLKDRVKCAAMSNSVHTIDSMKKEGVRSWFYSNCINWQVSQQEKGDKIIEPRLGCTCISSNLEIADFTLTECMQEMMDFVFVKMGDIEREETEEIAKEADILKDMEEHLDMNSIE